MSRSNPQFLPPKITVDISSIPYECGYLGEKAKPIVRWGRKATGLFTAKIAGLPAVGNRTFFCECCFKTGGDYV